MAIIGTFILPHPPIILPEIGRGEEKKIQTTIDSCNEVARQIAELKPDTIVLTSPHSIMYSDYFHVSPGISAYGDLGGFGADQIQLSVKYDKEFTAVLEALAEFSNFPAGTLGEKDPSLDHGTIIPLTFINQYYSDYKLVRIGLSDLPAMEHYKLGQLIHTVSYKLGRKVVLIASGDLSHKVAEDGPYGYSEEGRIFDADITSAMASGDFLRFLTFPPSVIKQAAECGLRSFIIMAGALDSRKVIPKLYSYEGTFGVGYGVASYLPLEEDRSRNFLVKFKKLEQENMKQLREMESIYVKLARASIFHYINYGELLQVPSDLPKEMLTDRAGVFVSIKKYGKLRGCIGTLEPVTDCVAEEIIYNAVSSAINDPRFDTIQEDELEWLTYSVDILSSPEMIDSIELLDVKRYGIIVSSEDKRGVLLPNLDGIETVEQQLAIALQKAKILAHEKYYMERFMVTRYH